MQPIITPDTTECVWTQAITDSQASGHVPGNCTGARQLQERQELHDVKREKSTCKTALGMIKHTHMAPRCVVERTHLFEWAIHAGAAASQEDRAGQPLQSGDGSDRR